MSVQPISPVAIVARIWEIYRDQVVVLLGTALVLFGIEFVVSLLIPGSTLALTILFWALGILYQGMVVELVRDVQDGRRDHSIGGLISSVEPVFWPLAAVTILFGIALGIGLLLLIVPGLIAMVIWWVVVPVTILERPGVLAAFGRSQELVRGNGWSVFGVIVLVFLVIGAISIAAGLLAAPLGSLGQALVTWAVTAALAPLTALSASVLYFALVGHDG